jgi:hypothetical protein
MLEHLGSSALIAAFSLADGAGAQLLQKPVFVVAHSEPGRVRLEVWGSSTVSLGGRYDLEVSSGGRNSNKSVQSGSLRLQPDKPARLSTATFSVSSDGAWEGKLKVFLDGADPYQQVVRP